MPDNRYARPSRVYSSSFEECEAVFDVHVLHENQCCLAILKKFVNVSPDTDQFIPSHYIILDPHFAIVLRVIKRL
jgi:hypothetical protein